jgi:chlorobactene glucosyltransferase
VIALAIHGAVLAALLALLVQVLLNTRAVPRLARIAPARSPRVAVLIPARNEASGIARSVAAWARQAYAPCEVIVLDDDSSDGTAAAAGRAAARFPHVRVVRGAGVEPGWRGKPWACDRLRRQTRADLLVFADADVEPAPETLARLVGALEALAADLVSVLPAHRSPSRAVQALVALQNWAALAFVPAWLAALRRSPTFAAANGQLLAIRTSVYDAVGGFAAVRGTLAEDAALGRRVAAAGHAVRLVDGAGLVRCRAYPDPAALWRANVRNLHAVLFGSLALAGVAAVGLVALFVAPPLALAFRLVGGGPDGAMLTLLPLAEVALGTATRAIVDRRAGYGRGLCLLHPVACGVLAAMILDSAARARLGRAIEWRGRRYRVRDGTG